MGSALKMVILGENKKIALINNQILFEGSIYNGDTVTKILEREVILKGESGETRLAMVREVPGQFEPYEMDGTEKSFEATSQQKHSVEGMIKKLQPFLKKGQTQELNRVLDSQKQ